HKHPLGQTLRRKLPTKAPLWVTVDEGEKKSPGNSSGLVSALRVGRGRAGALRRSLASETRFYWFSSASEAGVLCGYSGMLAAAPFWSRAWVSLLVAQAGSCSAASRAEGRSAKVFDRLQTTRLDENFGTRRGLQRSMNDTPVILPLPP